jgi:hypothetical protein
MDSARVTTDEARPALSAMTESLAPQAPRHADAAAPAQSGAVAPELARPMPDSHAMALSPAVPAMAMAPTAGQHDAVQRDDSPQPSVSNAQLENVGDVHVLTDHELAGVSAASDEVASSSIGAGLPGV